MSYRVEIAEAAEADLPVEERIASVPDLKAAWSTRLRVTLDVDPNEPLGGLLRRAGTQLDQMGPHGSRPEPWAPTYLATYSEDSETWLWNELSLVDEKGHVRWNHRWQEEPYSELLRASEAGVLPGDPYRLYFIRMGGAGDGVLSSFPEFVQLTSMWWEVLKTTFDVVGIAGTAAWLIELTESGERATEVVDEKADKWRANGAQPFKVKELVRRPHGWEPAALGRLLDITESDAKALLSAFGCKETPGGMWRPGTDEVSKLMADNMELVLSSAHIDKDAFQGEIRRRLDSFIETGKAPAPDYDVMAALPLDPHWSANHAAISDAMNDENYGQGKTRGRRWPWQRWRG
jgi:hypothetical protein